MNKNYNLSFNNDDEYFKEITNITGSIDKDETILKYFNENTDALMLLTEETLKELNRVPCIYDFNYYVEKDLK